MNESSNNNGVLVVITGILWVVVTLMAWFGYWFQGIFVSFVMMLLYLIAGAKLHGKLDKTFLIYPIFSWFVLWMVSFWLVGHYSDMFRGNAPTFTILGFHPSFAWVFIAWVGSVLTLTLGFYLLRDKWLPQEDWDAYQAKIQQLNSERNKGGKSYE
ncbi:MAG: hypothetical protein PWP51_525 [Clostridiales bacterium]|jgi:hypothetical protein|nr:hypothetical protein [Clostridiales bacterium]MDN5297972.1 hypothetical protein [Clostridiales bacterium]